MFFVYLFSAVVGCTLVLVSLFGGGQHDGATDGGGAALDSSGVDSSSALDGPVAADGSQSLDGHHGHGDAGAAHGHGHGMLGALGWMLSLQLWTYLLAFGGLTGLLLRAVAHLAEPLAATGALTVGLSTALGARFVLRRLVQSADSGTTNHERLIGSSAQVLIPAAAGGTGKIRLSARGHMIDLLARASDGGALLEGAAVSILEVREGVAEVTRDEDESDAGEGGARNRAALPAPASPLFDAASIKSKG